jgi:outer membrane protein TolC
MLPLLLLLLAAVALRCGRPALAAEPDSAPPLDLAAAIAEALKGNLDLQAAAEELQAARFNRQVQATRLLPTVNVAYRYQHRDAEALQRFEIPGLSLPPSVVAPQEDYSLSTTLSQPIFTGFALINRLRIAGLAEEIAALRQSLGRQTVIFETQRRYFQVLKAQQLQRVAQETVRQIAAQRDVADSFFQVGMTPRNDLLQAQVELANAEQALVVADNDLSLARADLNLLLRRPITGPLVLVDMLDWSPYSLGAEECQALAARQRLEIPVADREVLLAAKEVELARKDFYPSVDLQGSYLERGDDWQLDGGQGVGDESSWNLTAVASWNVWEWGRTTYGVGERRSRLQQARLRRQEVEERIRFEVQQAYLRTRDSERNITTVAQAIEQARENLRINEERYREQVATSTDVLIAQTLLTRTVTNYTNALYNFHLAKASLDLAMGTETGE